MKMYHKETRNAVEWIRETQKESRTLPEVYAWEE